MKKKRNIFLNLISGIFGVFFLLAIIVCLALLWKFLYFSKKPAPVVKHEKPIDKFSKTIDTTVGAGHFHLLDETAYSDADNAPMCLRCHGNYCHKKSKDLRSFYNMHTFYLACETCHIRQTDTESFIFQWFDDRTGKRVTKIKGKQGSYGAKVVPVKAGVRLDKFPKEELAIDFMRFRDTYTEEEKEKIKKELMEHVSKEPVTCKECHKENGYLNFAALGYKKDRIKMLTHLEIIHLIDEYKQFFLPTMFEPPRVKK